MQPQPDTRSHADAQASSLKSARLWVRPHVLGWLIDGLFFSLVLLLVAAIWSGLSIWLALGAQLIVLAAWDLGRFALRQPAARRGRHVRWLGLALVIGALLAAGALLLRFDLGFWLALGLAVVLTVLLAQVSRIRAR